MQAGENSCSSVPGPRTIVFLAVPAAQILDVAAPFQVFVRAAEFFAQQHPDQKGLATLTGLIRLTPHPWRGGAEDGAVVSLRSARTAFECAAHSPA